MSDDKGRYWFYAKTYGIGFGLPATWEGWAVLTAYLVLLLVGTRFLSERLGMFIFLYIAAITAAFIVVVAAKGEKPITWRWGRRNGR